MRLMRERGWTPQELGRFGGIASGAARRQRRAQKELKATQPRLAALLKRSGPNR